MWITSNAHTHKYNAYFGNISFFFLFSKTNLEFFCNDKSLYNEALT